MSRGRRVAHKDDLLTLYVFMFLGIFAHRVVHTRKATTPISPRVMVRNGVGSSRMGDLSMYLDMVGNIKH